jgi:hypothetical protein
MPVTLLVDWGYGVGTVLAIDTAFDRSEAETYAATVRNQPLDTIIGLQLKIGPWGPYRESYIVVSG